MIGWKAQWFKVVEEEEEGKGGEAQGSDLD